jgi:GMP synthase-like glutamine amidotransferase
MVRLGLLQCDSLDRPHVDVDGDYDALFTELLSRSDVEVIAYRADLGRLPGSLDECDGWVVPGSRQSVYDDIDWIVDLRRLVGRLLAADRPLVGVCFGHQMIAQELGATVARADGGWNIGAIEYRLHRPPPGEERGWAGHPGEPAADRRFSLIASHQDQVLELPDGAELLASAPTCPIAGYTIGERVLSVQGHPEFGPELAGSLYRSRVERIGAAPIEAALATLGRPLDRARVADWIVEVARR